jgi:hypothetical protein
MKQMATTKRTQLKIAKYENKIDDLEVQVQDIEDELEAVLSMREARAYVAGYQAAIENFSEMFDGTNGYRTLSALEAYLKYRLELWLISESKVMPLFTMKDGCKE